ncbi:MAG: hypothetical protein M1818_005223 [Claussenomyces sp. TS43310]|nr:MAG: hypothetical protein M1818_005223 [Claussenomyces sp. TS43310]
MAEYVTKAQLQELGLEHTAVERDSTFGIARPKDTTGVADEEEAPVPVTLDLLKPDRAMAVLSMLLPANIDFFRTPIAATPPPVQRHSPSIPASSRLSEAALEERPQHSPEKVDIYGSVTTADIASQLKAILAENPEGARVVLSPEEISFVEEGEEHDRVKHLGIFEIDIWVKGAPDAVRRTIKVNAQE